MGDLTARGGAFPPQWNGGGMALGQIALPAPTSAVMGAQESPVSNFRGNSGPVVPFSSASEEKNIQTNFTGPTTVFARPLPNGAQMEIGEHMPVFSVRGDFDAALGLTTFMDLCEMNSRLEQGSVVLARDRTENTQLSEWKMNTLEDEQREYFCNTAHEWKQKFAWAGPMLTSEVDPAEQNEWSTLGISRDSMTRVMNLVSIGRGQIHNVFGTDLRKRDLLYWVCKKIPSPYDFLYVPDGSYIAGRTGPETPILQVMGWTSNESDRPFNNTNADMPAPGSDLSPLAPHDHDVDYWDIDRKVQRDHRVIRWHTDADGNPFWQYDEVDQGAEIPPFIYQTYYEQGTVTFIGGVSELGEPTTNTNIVQAHRNRHVLAASPKVEVMFAY